MWRHSLWGEKGSEYPSDPPFNDGLGCEHALADGRELHVSPCTPFISACFIIFGFPRVLLGLFNSAHPIIRNLGRTSSRLSLSLLPGTAAGRSALAPLLLRAPGLWAEGRSAAAPAAAQECLARRDERSQGLPERIHGPPEVPEERVEGGGGESVESEPKD